MFRKGVWPGTRDPLNFWPLNANSSKIDKATDFKFDVHVSRDSPYMTPLKFPKKGTWPESRDPLNFWQLNDNSSKTAKATDVHVSRDSACMTP